MSQHEEGSLLGLRHGPGPVIGWPSPHRCRNSNSETVHVAGQQPLYSGLDENVTRQTTYCGLLFVLAASSGRSSLKGSVLS